MGIKKGGLKVGQEGSLKKKQYETYKAEKEAQLNKAKRLQKTYEGASPSIKADLDKKFEGVFNPKDMVSSSRRDAAKTYYASGGRASFRGGGMCKKGMNKKARGANS